MIKRRIVAFILMLLLVFNTECIVPLAASNIPNDIFLRQERSDTCTASAATMMLRAKMYLSGDDRWSSITESSVRSVAWTTSGLSFSFTYSVDGATTMNVNHGSAKGISVSRLKQLLNEHPEGIVFYCYTSSKKQHAVLLTDYEGDTFYCADPASSYAGARIPLMGSLLADKYGSFSEILANANGYWYISSSNIIAGNNPVGFLDSAGGGPGNVNVQGWALDRDDPNASLEYHVYIGGPAGDPNAEAHGGFIANKERADVDAHPDFRGLGKYHGYADWIETNKRGEQPVYVYAINVGGGNNNTLLGTKIVYISETNEINFQYEKISLKPFASQSCPFTFQGEQIGALDYSIDDNSICEVTGFGTTSFQNKTSSVFVKGKKAGTTRVNLHLKDQNKEIMYTKSFEVTVSSDVRKLDFSQSTINLDLLKNNTMSSDTDISDMHVFETKLEYDESFMAAEVEYIENGKKLQVNFRAIKPGNTMVAITALDMYGNEIGKGSVKVVVAQPVTGITLDQTALTMKIADTKTLTATVLPTKATNKAISWSSANKDVAKVDANGKVTAVGQGTTTITAKAKDGSGKKATCTITVIKPVEKIKLNKTTLSLKNGASETLKATVTPTDADDKTVTWKSTNTKVVTVNSKGKVVAVGVGTAKITATAKDGSGKKATCTVTVSNDLTSRFTDIDPNAWYVEGIQYVVDAGIMNGVGGTTEFAPNKELTRAEFVTVLHNIEGQPSVKYSKKFTDVENGKWYTTPILWAQSKEIVAGFTDGTFGTNKKITREQLAVMLYKYCSYKGISTTRKKGVLINYSDGSKVSDWAKEAMEWAVSRGVMSGKGTGTNKIRLQLDPLGNATRAECATMIMKVLDNRMVDIK